MVSAPETVVRNVLLSQHKGATAVVTAEAQVPMMTGTRSTSMSLRAAFTAASGLVWSSSMMNSICRPSRPPAALTSLATACMPASMRGPSAEPAPVSGVRTPRRSGAPCARNVAGAKAVAASAPAPVMMVRRVGFGVVIADSSSAAGALAQQQVRGERQDQRRRHQDKGEGAAERPVRLLGNLVVDERRHHLKARPAEQHRSRIGVHRQDKA